MNILAHNLVIQMRIYKKAKEKRLNAPIPSSVLMNKLNSSTGSNSPSINNGNSSNLMAAAQAIAASNETNLIDMFFDLEAEIEKGICRDNISYSSAEKEHGKQNAKI